MSTRRPPNWFQRLSQAFRNGCRRRRHSRTARSIPIHLEGLEDRLVPSGGEAFPTYILGPASGLSPLTNPASIYQSGGVFTPLGIQTAYGVSQLPSNDNGAGQTIAVVDAYDDPDLLDSTDPHFAGSDLAKFDAMFGLPDPVFLKVSQTGSATNLPGTDPAGAGNPNGNWEIEEALDVEYAHTVAPAAKILLVECNSADTSDLFAGVDWAAKSAAAGGGGASAVSMSFGIDGGFSGETSYDGVFSPAAYPGVTFLASAGDNGPTHPLGGTKAQADYPADSPNVVAVGGVNLQANATTGAYTSESVWNELAIGAGATGAGVSNFESQPSYQAPAAAPFGATNRVAPDVALDADPYSGVFIYDSYNFSLFDSDVYDIGGTSLASPLMAGVVSIADQIRAADGMTSLTGATQTLPILYGLYSTSHYSQDFHDVTSGSVGGYSAGVGYDQASGLGSPIVNKLAPDLATGALAITSAADAAFTVGVNQSFTVTDFGGPTPTLTESGALPANLTFTPGPGGGVLSGTAQPATAGVYTITFTASNAAGSVSQTFTLTVTSAQTSTVVNGVPNPVVFGHPTTLTATVTDASGSATPAGSVEFFDGAIDLGAGVAGTANGAVQTWTLTTSALPSGPQVITANYTAAPGFQSSSGTFTEDVLAVASSALSSSQNPADFGTSLTFTDVVADTSGSAAPTGTVTFTVSGAGISFGPVTLVGSGKTATATWTTPTSGSSELPVGVDNVVAVYNPTGDFVSSQGSLNQTVNAVTTTGVSSSLNPSVFGVGVTFTATVSNSSGTATPTGSVEFFDGTTDLGPGSALSGGGAAVVSTFTTSTLPAGPDNIIAKYTPAGTFVSSQGAINQQIDAVTTTAVSSGANPSVFGGSVTLTATVSNASGTASPTGSVEFFDGTTDLGPGSALSGGGAAVVSTFTTSTLPAGPDNIIAKYTPAGTFVSSQGSLNQTVNAVTTTGVTSSLNPSVFDDPVTFTATVSNTSGSATPTGSVEFFDGTTDLGPGSALSGGGAAVTSTFTTSTLPAGIDDVTAKYTAAGDFVSSQGSINQTVYAVTATAVSSSLNPSVFDDSVTFTATVSNSSGTATPTGSVEFFDGTTDLGPGSALSGGAAAASTFTTSTLPAGVDNIIAKYTAIGDFVSSQGSLNQTVYAVTTTVVSSSLNPSVFDDSVTLTATVSNTSGTATPTGSVEFFDGLVDLGPGSVLTGSGATAASTFTTTSLPAGADDIHAVYTPAGLFVGSNGMLTQNVQASTTTSVTSSNNPSVHGNAATFTATIVNADSSATPTGTVEFFDGIVDLGPGSALAGNGGSAVSTVTTSTLPVGLDTIEAVYTAAGDFVSSSGTVTQTVIATVFPAPPATITTAVLKTDGELDLFNQQTGSVSMISPAGAIAFMTTALNPAGQTVVFAVVMDADAQGNLHTLWEYNPADPTAPWSEISTGSFDQISGADTASSVPVVYAVVADGSLWEQNPANGIGLNAGWTQLSSGSFQSISPVSTPTGVLVYGVVAGGSLWEQNPANGTGLNVGWTEASSGSFQSISPGVNSGGQTVVYALTAGGSLWEQNPANGTGLNAGWTQLSGGSLASGNGTAPTAFLTEASGGADTVFAIASDGTLWQHKNAGWTELSPGSFAQISATETASGADLVFAVLSDGEFWDYASTLLPADPWTQVQQSGRPATDVAFSSVMG